MTDPIAAERLLRHPVAVTIPGRDPAVTIAASVAGDPPATRLAWIDWSAASIVARLSCPPARPSRPRPVVATEVQVKQAGVEDRVLALRAAPGVGAVRVVEATDHPSDAVAVGTDGIALVHVRAERLILAVEALDAAGEPVGTLDAAGIGVMRLEAGRITGRLGVGHGMAAGFGAGRWAADADEAAFEAGYRPILPAWIPPDLEPGPFHVEPDVAYPSAPPALAVAWGREPQRVLLRQAPAPLASPDTGHARAVVVAVGAAEGRLMTRRRFGTLVWETPDRAFGIQIVGFDDPGAVAVRIGASL